ncbi:MAG: COX15/CtaA family protein [Desulfurococcales archaeon]|nr:COX15/CtaA family protein [Desulfurococcales archaeon]
MKKGFVLSLASIASILGTIIIGGIVKASNAGMACGVDWPHCNGSLIPIGLLSDHGVALEYFHRIAGATSLVSVAILAITSAREGGVEAYLSMAALIVLVIQAMIGMVVVKSYLEDTLVAAHLALASISLALVSALAGIYYARSSG